MLSKLRLTVRHVGWRGVLVAARWKATKALARLAGRRHLVREVHGFRMSLDVHDRGISHTLLLFGDRERDMRKMIEAVVQPGDLFLDVGGNLGYYALQASRLVGENGRVVSIEPSPDNAALLRANVGQNGARNVLVVEGAVSETSGERELTLATASNLHTFHPETASGRFAFERRVPVRTYTLPELARLHGPPAVVRMDIEGHEVEVLRGALPAIDEGVRPTFVLEVHRRAYGPGHDMEAVLWELFSRGYRVASLSSSGPDGTRDLDARGLPKVDEFDTDFSRRAIYRDVPHDVAVDLVCRKGGVRTITLAPK